MPKIHKFKKMQYEAKYNKIEGLWRFKFPYPPSVNQHWKTGGKGRGGIYVSRASAIYKHDIAIMFKLYRIELGHYLNDFDPGTVELTINIDRIHKDNIKRDLDNILKDLFDAIEVSGIIKNDNQIVSLHMTKAVVDPQAKESYITGTIVPKARLEATPGEPTLDMAA